MGFLFNKFTDIDAISEADGNYIAGFVDGEGCFMLWTEKGIKRRNQASFSVTLRVDDIEILAWIRDTLGCGFVYEQKKTYGKNPNRFASYLVRDISSHLNVLVPFFVRFPLRAKKKMDFEVWSQAVRMMAKVKKRRQQSLGEYGMLKKWTPEDRLQFSKFVAELKRVRDCNLPKEVIS